jgi:hypothetical protein
MYRLPDDLRSAFKEPFGPVLATKELLESLSAEDTVVAVGDVVARTILEAGVRPKMIIVDYRTQRGGHDPALKKALGSWGDTVVQVTNPAATLTDELVAAVRQGLAADGTTRIEVDGEEDLAGLPVFAHALDGTIVLYGMPNRGVVRVVVDAEKRALAHRLFERMQTE